MSQTMNTIFDVMAKYLYIGLMGVAAIVLLCLMLKVFIDMWRHGS